MPIKLENIIIPKIVIRILYIASALVFSPYDSPEIVPTSIKYVKVCQKNFPKAPSTEIIPTKNKR